MKTKTNNVYRNFVYLTGTPAFIRAGLRWVEHPGTIKRRVRASGYNLDTGETPPRHFKAQMEEIGL